ncbi:GT-D fold domain-containing glycosyltransferase [Paenibacillus sp. OV219]|uniref:GT-D fold domain-containing protein n=1 Tax=Paenibacillus sp. OV219 TaxID=1884377 RepID=UPI0008AFE8F4|nr:GT-D fold domain-containing glycosyltransferase [Paenibacillus sp. OV219]SEN75807.1 hypothetical protein SAMN05518847_10465 [Paenibacillus sp. OV219]
MSRGSRVGSGMTISANRVLLTKVRQPSVTTSKAQSQSTDTPIKSTSGAGVGAVQKPIFKRKPTSSVTRPITRPRLQGAKRRIGGRKRPLGGRLNRRRRKTPTITHPPAEHRQYHDNAFSAGYELGKYEGGEHMLEQALPLQLLLPEISLQEVIALGASQLVPRCLPLLGVHEVYGEMEQAIHERRPCSIVRLGDGELLTLAQDVVYDADTISREGTFLPYAGVVPPDLEAREQLVQAIRGAGIVGVPQSRRKHFHPLLHAVLRANHIDLGQLRLTSSTVNYALQQSGLLSRLLAGKNLLVIGNTAPALVHVLAQHGCTISGMITPVRGVKDVDRVVQEAHGVHFDLALVSAGIPAVIICTRIANELGRVALDFGHMADSIVKGQLTL